MIRPDDIATKGIGPILRLIIRFIPYIFLSIRNYCRRPRLKVSLSIKHILFEDANSAKHDYSFPCIILENRTDKEYKIEAGSIKINRESYSVCVQSNPIFNRCNEGTHSDKKLTCLDETNIASFVKQNWQNIVQNNAPPIILSAHEKIILPLFFHHNPHFIVAKYENSQLWLASNKISVRMRINSTDIEYAINRKAVYETVINWLAFWDNRLS